MTAWIPKQGDLVVLDFDPQAGHEQKGRRPALVVSKEAFIESLTNWEEDLSANAIEVYISRLRAKLEPAGIRIRTVRGFGYMLEEYQAKDA